MTQTALQGREYAGVSIPPAGTYELDPTHTVVGFVTRHMLSKVRGQFTEFAGTIKVGDSPENDVAGALRAGLRAVLLRRAGALSAGTELAAGVPVIASLAELPALV